MTVAEAVARADWLCCNTFCLEDKLSWLTKLEWMLKTNVLDTHEGGIPFPHGNALSGQEALLAPAPFDELYPRWLEAQIHLYNGETDRFNAAIVLFNAEYAAFESWYNRTYPPRSRGNWK